jgi:4-amino-4-deoxy-L-arabinose transferase-like glycosyltransferase
VADNMRHTGDWLSPQVDPGVPYFHKPPLYCWLTAATSGWFADGPARYRAWSAAFGVGAVLLTGALGARLFGPEAGLLAGLMLARNGAFRSAHGACDGCFDAALTFFALAACAAYWRGGRVGWLLSGAAAGCACLLKPLTGLPVLALLGLHHLTRPRPAGGRAAGPLLALAACAAVAAPWHLAQAARFGRAFLDGYLWENLVVRATTRLDPGHLHGPGFYPAAVARSSGPFALALPAVAFCLAAGARGPRRDAYRLVSLFAAG